MSRKIKFRYKVKGRKKLLYDTDDDFAYLQRERKMIAGGGGGLFFVEREMQFTGFEDKNKIEIWEGDIYKVRGETFIVGWDDGGFDVTNIKDIDDQYYLHQEWYQGGKVIGNTVEDQKLLK